MGIKMYSTFSCIDSVWPGISNSWRVRRSRE